MTLVLFIQVDNSLIITNNYRSVELTQAERCALSTLGLLYSVVWLHIAFDLSRSFKLFQGHGHSHISKAIWPSIVVCDLSSFSCHFLEIASRSWKRPHLSTDPFEFRGQTWRLKYETFSHFSVSFETACFGNFVTMDFFNRQTTDNRWHLMTMQLQHSAKRLPFQREMLIFLKIN